MVKLKSADTVVEYMSPDDAICKSNGLRLLGSLQPGICQTPRQRYSLGYYTDIEISRRVAVVRSTDLTQSRSHNLSLLMRFCYTIPLI